MKEILEKIFTFFQTIWVEGIVSDEGLATLLVVLIIALKLLINRKVTSLHLKKMLVSIPSEITFLAIGFLLSAMIVSSPAKDIRGIMAVIVISLIVISIQYALERHLDDKLSGKLDPKIMFYIVMMYVSSIILYCTVVYGGICK